MFVSDTMPYAPVRLQEACIMVIIRERLSRDCLPDILIGEVGDVERNINSAFSGTFWTYSSAWISSTGMISIKLDHGRLEITFEDVKLAGYEKESLLIKSGVKKQLGNLGCERFMLPGQEVFICAYRVDLSNMVLSLHGSCSSTFKDCENHPLIINFRFFPEDDDLTSVWIETVPCCPLLEIKVFSYEELFAEDDSTEAEVT